MRSLKRHRRWRRGTLVALAIGALAGNAVAQGGAAKGFLDEARAAEAGGRYVDALAAYAEAIAAAPGDASVLAQRASLFIVLGQPDLAALDYRAAVKRKPGDAGLQINLCLNLAMANHDLDGALAACNAAVGIEPGNHEALSARGYVQLRRGAWAAAEKDFAAALAVNPASPNEMFGHGLAAIHLGRAQEGRDEIASATLDSSNLVNDWARRGFGARGEVRPEKAETNATQPIASIEEQKVFLNGDEMPVGAVGSCGMVMPKALAAGRRELRPEGGSMSGVCRFGLVHGDWTVTEGATARVIHFAYGREIAPDAGGAALGRKLRLAYEAAEKAVAP